MVYSSLLFIYGSFPAALLMYYVTPKKYRSITLLENTSIVCFIAIKDLTKVVDIVRSQTYDALVPLGLLAVIYFLLTRLLGVVLDRIGDLFIQRHAR